MPPFMSAPKLAERELITIELELHDNQWGWNFTKLETLLADSDHKISLILLCNPHNPVGRVWTKAELMKLLELAIKYDVWVCSDEIHCDLVLDKNSQHIPFASINEEAAQSVYSCQVDHQLALI